MRNKVLFTIASAMLSVGAQAQTAFNTIEYLDINNIRSGILLHGDMWWDPATSQPSCEFPKGSGKHISQATALWMGAHDAAGELHTSTQTYRQSGNDFWPGPLDADDTLTYEQSEAWAKIWKVNKAEIEVFRNLTSPHDIFNTPVSILEWPANGNPYAMGGNGFALTIDEDMAPYVDVDGDGTYNPLQGDYPSIKGDQALWWVFSDNGSTHNHQSGTSLPLKVEVRAMAYAYDSIGTYGNTQFYQFDVINKSANNYNDFVLSFSSDVDLGYFNDDYIGFDSTRRMGIVYNGKTKDGNGEPGAYGTQIPQIGVLLMEHPADAVNIKEPVGSFMYYNNDFTVLGNPSEREHFYNYMTAAWLDGGHLKDDFTGAGNPSRGRGAGNDANYVFDGDPANNTQWSECASQNAPGDRRFILGSSKTPLVSEASARYVYAMVATVPAANNSCGSSTGFKNIKAAADTILGITPTPSSVANYSIENNGMTLYPNPAKEQLHVQLDKPSNNYKVQVYDVTGKEIKVAIQKAGNELTIDIEKILVGIYMIRCQGDGKTMSASFTKDKY